MGFAHDDVQRWFHEAGLADVRVESVGDECRAESCEGSLAVVSIFLAIGTVPECPSGLEGR